MESNLTPMAEYKARKAKERAAREWLERQISENITRVFSGMPFPVTLPDDSPRMFQK